jgi:hydrogenase-4 component F
MSLILMTTLVGTTTAIYCGKYLLNETLSNRLSSFKLRYFYSLYQFFFFIATLIFVSNNLGIVWVGMECATFCTVLLVSVSRSSQSLEAAWKYLIICGLGLAQALLGTILLFFATESVLSANDALLLSEITSVSHQLSQPIVGLAFVFILIGYGTKAGFFPLHNWLPDAYGESIAPVLSLLSGVLINAALYTVFRFKVIVDGSFGTEFAGHFLIGFGLINIIVASLFMLRQRELKRLFAYSSIEHVGIICFAFGIGTPLAIFAGLLHMLSHSLAKTAAFFSAGSAIQLRARILMSEITDLAKDSPGIGWGLLLSTFALIGLPPFSLFISEVLIILATIKYQAWLALPLVIGLLIAFSAMISHVQRMVFYSSGTNPDVSDVRVSVIPVYVHLMLLVAIGLLVPYLMSHFA